MRVMLPLNPDGLKLFPETPMPDQLPGMPLCVVFNDIGESNSQILAGIPEIIGVTGILMLIEVVVEVAH